MSALRPAYPPASGSSLDAGRVRRADEAHVLRQSLAASALSHLTLVVAAVLAATLLRGTPNLRIAIPHDLPGPPWVQPPVVLGNFAVAGRALPPPAPDVSGPVVPMDVESGPPSDYAPPTGLDVPPGPTGQGAGIVRSGDSDGTQIGAEAPPPDLNAWVFRNEDPIAVVKPDPVYSELAREAGAEGTVALRLLVGQDGRVRDVHVDRSIPILDSCALDAVRHWVFTPAKDGDKPVAVWVAVKFRFVLH